MILKPYIHTSKSALNKKKINFIKILKNKSLIKNPDLIKHALSKGTISTKNYDLERLGKKVKLKRNNSQSFEINTEKREIPYELLKIINSREKQYKKIDDLYKSLKKENDTFISYWHYTQRIKEKLEKQNYKENALEKDEENNEYKKIYKKYQFSNRDKIEMKLQKNLSKKIFKSNPLIMNNNNELFFYFIKEANESGNRSINFNEQNCSKYLIKIKDFSEYIRILKDKNLDSLNKKVKLSNCNFTRFQDQKIEEEKLRLLEEQESIDKKEIDESKIMIRNTSGLLNKLYQNKNYLEDPNYFVYYRNRDMGYLTPNKKMDYKLMNKSAKSDFFVGDKNHFLNKDKYNTMSILKLKRHNLSNQLNSILNESNAKKSKRIKKLRINNINPLIDKSNNETFSKDNNYSTMNLNFYNSKISNNHNYSTNNIFIERYTPKKILPSIKKYFPYNAFTKSSNSNSIQQPILLEGNKFEKKIKDSILIDNISKELYGNLNNKINLNNESDNHSSISSINNDDDNKNDNGKENDNIDEKENDNEKESEKNNEKENDKDNEEEKEKKKEKENDNIKENENEDTKENNIEKEEKNPKKIIIISDLYNEVKDKRKINQENIKEIDTYINQQRLEYKRKKNTVAMLKEVQLLIDEFDINKIAKNYNEIKNEESKKIKILKKMDKKLKKLDKRYMQEIIKFKVKNIKK